MVIRRLWVIWRETFLWSDVREARLAWVVTEWKWQMLTTLCSNEAGSGREKRGKYQKGDYAGGLERTGSWRNAAGRTRKQATQKQHSVDLVVMRTERAPSCQGSEPDLGSATLQLSWFSHLRYGVMGTTDPAP